MKLSILAACLLLISSCSTTNFIKTGTNPQTYTIVGETNVFVLTELPKDAKTVEEVGICSCAVPGGGVIRDNTHKAIANLKKCALKNGGNAIVLKNGDERGFNSVFGYSQQRAKAEAIVYYIEFEESKMQ